jgi:hypothetical protein
MKNIMTVLFALMAGAAFMMTQAEAKKKEKDVKPGADGTFKTCYRA